MLFRKIRGFGLCIMTLASLSFSGCVQIDITTSRPRVMAKEALPYPEQSLIEHKVRLSRFKSTKAGVEVEMQKEEVQNILDYATSVARCGKDNDDMECDLIFSDMHNDFGCKINFVLDDSSLPTGVQPTPIGQPATDISISSFNFDPDPNGPQSTPDGKPDPLNCLADGVICSMSDLNKVWNQSPADGIKLVREILACEVDGSRWAACAQFQHQGQAIAMTRHPDKDLKLEGILWLHELGHTKNLQHGTHPASLNKDSNAVMFSKVAMNKTKLNRKECYRLRNGLP